MHVLSPLVPSDELGVKRHTERCLARGYRNEIETGENCNPNFAAGCTETSDRDYSEGRITVLTARASSPQGAMLVIWSTSAPSGRSASLIRQCQSGPVPAA